MIEQLSTEQIKKSSEMVKSCGKRGYNYINILRQIRCDYQRDDEVEVLASKLIERVKFHLGRKLYDAFYNEKCIDEDSNE